MLVLIETLLMIRIWSGNDRLNNFGLSKTRREIFETQICSCPTRSMLQQLKQNKEMIGHISFDDIIPSVFLNFSNNGRARLVEKVSGTWFSVFTLWTFILSFATSSWIQWWATSRWVQWWATSMCFVRVMDSIEVAVFAALELSQKIGVFFCQSCRQSGNILQEFYFCDSLKQSIKLGFCGSSWDEILFPWFPIDQRITKENAGSKSAFSCFFTGSKITISEGEQFWVSCSFEHWWLCNWPSLLRKRTES